jgi:hypothetical protein
MNRLLMVIGASGLAVVLLVGGGLWLARERIGPAVAAAAGLPAFAADLPAELRDLHNLPPAERFSHFSGGQFRFTDANNAPHVVTITPGTVNSIAGDRLTIAPNEGGSSKTYNLNADTRIRAGGQRWGDNQAATPKAGDKVVVVTLDSSDTARAVMVGGADGFGPQRGPFRRD